MSVDQDDKDAENKNKKSSIPQPVADAAAVLSGAYIGYEGGKAAAEVISEQFNLPQGQAEALALSLETGGAALSTLAALELAKADPRKSIMYGMKALAGASAAIGAAAVAHKIEDMKGKIGDLEDKVAHLQGAGVSPPTNSLSGVQDQALTASLTPHDPSAYAPPDDDFIKNMNRPALEESGNPHIPDDHQPTYDGIDSHDHADDGSITAYDPQGPAP